MAIDSASKRASVASVSLEEALIIPDNTIDQADRQTIAFCYGGISSGEVVLSYRRRRVRYISSLRHGLGRGM